jgi:REP element-mobilizing transposase RayT
MRRRDYKNFANDSLYHIYNRGNNRERIFFDDQDYRAFLFRIALALNIDRKLIDGEEFLRMPKSRIRINTSPKDVFVLHGFCLMPNHFHLLLEQRGKGSISKLIHKICTSFSMYMNKKYRRVGHVFQDRFKSVLIENNSQFMWVSSYIHMNPVKSGLATNPYDYKWSSYKDFAEDRNLIIVSKDLTLDTFGNRESFVRETFQISDNVSRTRLDTFPSIFTDR